MRCPCAIDAGPVARCRSSGGRRGPARAFTFAELVVVLAIVSILGAMAIYRPSASLHAEKARAASERIVTDLAFAQRRAIHSSAAVTVEFTPASHRYRLIGLSDPDFVANEYAVDLSRPPYESRLSKADFGGLTTVSFSIFGTPSAAGEIVVTSGGVSRKVVLEAETGRASIQ